MRKYPSISSRWITTLASNVNCASRRVPLGLLAQTERSVFPLATRTTTGEFIGGFKNWVEQIADSKNASDYRRRVTDPESASMWQSLSFGANYKSAYCMGVCPAGDDVLPPFLTDRAQYLKDVVRPLQDKEETVYVVPKSDAEDYVARHFPNKHTKRVGNSLNRLRSISSFLFGLPLTFQRNQLKGIDATYHFTFTGAEHRKKTVTIRDQRLEVMEGHNDHADLGITAH